MDYCDPRIKGAQPDQLSNEQSHSRRVSEQFFAPLSFCKESGKPHRDSGEKTLRRRRKEAVFELPLYLNNCAPA